MRDIILKAMVDEGMTRAEEIAPDAAAGLNEETRSALREAMIAAISDAQPKLEKLLGSGAERYEARLRGVGLGTAEHRLIPGDLDEALTELGAIRDVIVHRASRIDAKALAQASSLAERYREGDFVRLNGDDYRRYSAAIRCYGQDVAIRPMRSWPGFDEATMPDLTRWRDYYVLGE